MTKLDELTAAITGKQVYIQTHNYPDQDALASAWGLSRLLASRGIESIICYEGILDKVNTVEMVQQCQIPVHHISEVWMTTKDEIILVDGQSGNVNVDEFAGMEIACIDHHRSQSRRKYRFQDIRMAGSCATIIAEYFRENEVPLDEKMATALLYGMKVDTASMTRGVTEADIDMFVYLYKRADARLLTILDSYSLTVNDLSAYQEAIASLKISGNFGVANAGEGCSEAMIGTLSDFLISLAEIDFCMVYSYRVGGLKLSVRSVREEWDASRIIQQVLTGYGGGGGHATMAAGFIAGLTREEAIQHAERIIGEIQEILRRTEL